MQLDKTAAISCLGGERDVWSSRMANNASNAENACGRSFLMDDEYGANGAVNVMCKYCRAVQSGAHASDKGG